MNKLFKVVKQDSLKEEIESVLRCMSTLNCTSEEYSKSADNLEKLYRAQGYNKNTSISPDTLLLVIGNLAGIALILWHERAEVITSKALGFVMKGRV